MAEAEAGLFSCHLERNDVESEALLTQIDFRTRNKERRFLIVMRKSVVIRLVRGKSVCLLFELICESQINLPLPFRWASVTFGVSKIGL